MLNKGIYTLGIYLVNVCIKIFSIPFYLQHLCRTGLFLLPLYKEKEILYIFIAYPEKYRKLVNSYFNGKKSWVSIRITEKLEELLKSEDNKKKFLEQFIKYYL